MPGPVSLVFDWDPAKAQSNLKKHRVDFTEVLTVFRDSLALSILDRDGGDEERWVTLGTTSDGSLRLVVHTWVELDANRVSVRIISARRPTRKEARQYRDIV